MKTSEAFQIGTDVWKIDGKEIKYLWVKENKLDCTLTKEPQIIFHILCDMGLPCSKLNNSNLIKDKT